MLCTHVQPSALPSTQAAPNTKQIYMYFKKEMWFQEAGWHETELRGGTDIQLLEKGSTADLAGASIAVCRTPRISSPRSQGKPQFQDQLLETLSFASLVFLI